MKEYVAHNGKVTEIKSCGGWGKKISYITKSGTMVFNANSAYKCDENGKSLETGEYYNRKDDFFPWKNGVFCDNKIKIRTLNIKMKQL